MYNYIKLTDRGKWRQSTKGKKVSLKKRKNFPSVGLAFR
jgi:hypothetical protein